MRKKKENDKLMFTCFYCKKENLISRSHYIQDNEECFLEWEGKDNSCKGVIITCSYCFENNKVDIPYS